LRFLSASAGTTDFHSPFLIGAFSWIPRSRPHRRTSLTLNRHRQLALNAEQTARVVSSVNAVSALRLDTTCNDFGTGDHCTVPSCKSIRGRRGVSKTA